MGNSIIFLSEQFIREYDWSLVLNTVDVDDDVRLFLQATSSMFDTFFDDKPYITERIKKTMYGRDKSYQRGQVERFKSLRPIYTMRQVVYDSCPGVCIRVIACKVAHILNFAVN